MWCRPTPSAATTRPPPWRSMRPASSSSRIDGAHLADRQVGRARQLVERDRRRAEPLDHAFRASAGASSASRRQRRRTLRALRKQVHARPRACPRTRRTGRARRNSGGSALLSASARRSPARRAIGQSAQDVIDVGAEGGRRRGSGSLVPSARGIRAASPGTAKHLAALLGREARRVMSEPERRGRLDHHHPEREPGDEPVASRKVAAARLPAETASRRAPRRPPESAA